MHYFIYPESDTTLYSASGSMNTGLDEILEIRKDVDDSGVKAKVSRILMKFDLAYISQSMHRGLITNPKFYLNLYDANPTDLSVSQSLWAHPVSQSWDVGEGFRFDSPTTTDGASWNYRTSETAEDWWLEASASLSGSVAQGGTFYSNVYASQSFSYGSQDMRMDVTPIVNKWITGAAASRYTNEGFILKRSGSLGNGAAESAEFVSGSGEEGDKKKYGNFSFFSRQTNTIYPPKLEVEWFDTKWSTGSLSPLDSDELDDLAFYMKNIRATYKEKSKVKFRVNGRGRYPTKSFSNTSSAFLTSKYLPSGSLENIGGDGVYYSIVDDKTADVIIPFGTGSLVSCDSKGNYFNVWMDAFQAERYYKFEFKVVSGSGTSEETIQFFDDDFLFKVTR